MKIVCGAWASIGGSAACTSQDRVRCGDGTPRSARWFSLSTFAPASALRRYGRQALAPAAARLITDALRRGRLLHPRTFAPAPRDELSVASARQAPPRCILIDHVP